jgi:hypothetical protein
MTDVTITKVGRAAARSLYGIVGGWPLTGEPDRSDESMVRHANVHHLVGQVVVDFDAALKKAFDNRRLTLAERDTQVEAVTTKARTQLRDLRIRALEADKQAAEVNLRLWDGLAQQMDRGIRDFVWMRIAAGGRDMAHQLAQRALDNSDQAVLSAIALIPPSLGFDMVPPLAARVRDRALQIHDSALFGRVRDLRKVADVLAAAIANADQFVDAESVAAGNEGGVEAIRDRLTRSAG